MPIRWSAMEVSQALDEIDAHLRESEPELQKADC